MAASVPTTVRPTDCCAPNCDDVTVQQVPGPAGADGAAGAAGTDGVNAFTTTNAQFVMPAAAATVNVTVLVSEWAAIGQVVFVTGAGYFTVDAVPDATHITLRNLGYTGNVAPTTVVPASQQVSPGGLIGPTGSSGAGTLNALSPTTTKGDIIVDNGANSPAASDIRLAVGTDGQVLASVSTQPSGLQWKTVAPNATTDNGIPRFDGTTGTPVPLQTSNVVISDNGAVQASGSGGNARGTDATDLQVSRAVATQVASGSNAGILSGINNTASGTRSVVLGGSTNLASGQNGVAVGGFSNISNGDRTFVGAGQSNQASNPDSAVVSGNGNSASALRSFIGGGNANTAGGNESVVAGGSDNNASAEGASILGGLGALADKYGQQAQAAGSFNIAGDSQTSVLVARNSTSDATPTVLFLDGSAARITISDDTTWAFRILVVARRTDANDESAAYEFVGCVDRNVGVATTALVGSVTKVVVAEDTAAWDANVTADAANGALSITVTGEVGKSLQWVARIELVETTG